jgi:hypothetical protein
VAERHLQPAPPVVDEPQRPPTWLDDAACRGKWHVFDARDIESAVAICRSCPVLLPCRAWALETVVAGVAGGMTEEDRLAHRIANLLPEPRADVSSFLPEEVVAADLANEALPDRPLRLVWSQP